LKGCRADARDVIITKNEILASLTLPKPSTLCWWP
jgi:hypothetical protein